MRDSIVKTVRVYQGSLDWRFNGIARNGRIITTSRGYNTKANALKSATATFPSAIIEIFDHRRKT